MAEKEKQKMLQLGKIKVAFKIGDRHHLIIFSGYLHSLFSVPAQNMRNPGGGTAGKTKQQQKA